MKRATGKEIRVAVAYWQKVLGLEDWQIRVVVGRVKGGDRARADVRWAYREAVLSFSPKEMQKAGDTVDGMVVHELGHCFTERTHEELQRRSKGPVDLQKLEDLEEADATWFDRLVLRLHRRPGT